MDVKKFGEGSLFTLVGGFRLVYFGVISLFGFKELPTWLASFFSFLAFLLMVLPMVDPMTVKGGHVVFCSWFLRRSIPTEFACFGIEAGLELLNTSRRRLTVLDRRTHKRYSVYSCIPEAGACWDFLTSAVESAGRKNPYMLTVERSRTEGEAFCMKLAGDVAGSNFTVIGRRRFGKKEWAVSTTKVMEFDRDSFLVSSSLVQSKLGDFWIES